MSVLRSFPATALLWISSVTLCIDDSKMLSKFGVTYAVQKLSGDPNLARSVAIDRNRFHLASLIRGLKSIDGTKEVEDILIKARQVIDDDCLFSADYRYFDKVRDLVLLTERSRTAITSADATTYGLVGVCLDLVKLRAARRLVDEIPDLRGMKLENWSAWKRGGGWFEKDRASTLARGLTFIYDKLEDRKYVVDKLKLLFGDKGMYVRLYHQRIRRSQA